MKNGRLVSVLSIVVNLFIVAVTVFSVSLFFTSKGQGNMEVAGTRAFRYFTVDSNILAAVASLLVMIFQIKNLFSRNAVATGAVPEWLRLLKFVSVVSVMLTFLTVVFFLGPLMGYRLMFVGTNLFLHLTTPLMALLSFWLLETGGRIRPGLFLPGVIPMLLYGAVYIYMVVFAQKWKDFYMFNASGQWWITAIIMTAATTAIAFGVGLLANVISRQLYK